MRVRMKVQVTGTRDGRDWPAVGGEVEVPDNEGAELASLGLAEPVVNWPAKAETREDKRPAAKRSRARKSD